MDILCDVFYMLYESLLRWLDIVITKTLLKNRELKTGRPFLRAGRGN
jgi:hypothetical protein